jgi:hypothetical protein
LSVEAITWAFDQDIPGPEKLLLLAIANHADPHGIAYAGQARLAKLCGIKERALRDNMHRLEEKGLLERRKRFKDGGARTSDWLILAPGGGSERSFARSPMKRIEDTDLPLPKAPPAESAGGSPAPRPPAVERRDHRQSTAGETSEGNVRGKRQEPPCSPSGQIGLIDTQPSRPSMIVNRKKVTNEEWQMVESILSRFNAVFGTSFSPRDRTPVSRIVMVLRREQSMGEVTPLHEHEAIIERNAAAPWWGNEQPDTVGVIYSPGAWPRAKRCTGVVTGRQARDLERERVMANLTAIENMSDEEVAAMRRGEHF